jgi:DNA-directed RNA polymerase subunit RPC12/RpoP
MSQPTYYVQECPTCGRNLHVRVDYLGRHIVCQHCQAKFLACDPSSVNYPPEDSSLTTLRKADQLLDSTSASASQKATA